MQIGNIAEKQALLESLEKQIKTKQTELSSTRLEIKSKVKLLEDLNEIVNLRVVQWMIADYGRQMQRMIMCC